MTQHGSRISRTLLAAGALALVAGVTLGLSGCATGAAGGGGAASSSSAITAEVLGDLNAYAPNMARLGKTEAALRARYEAVTGVNYKDDATMLAAVQGMLPDIDAYIAELEAVAPTTTPVKDAHALCIAGWKKQREAFGVMAQALSEQSADLVTQANALMTEANGLMSQYRAALAAIK